MKNALLMGVGLIAAGSLLGQGRNYGAGFGNVVFPGGVSAPTNAYGQGASFAQRLGATVGGVPYTGAPSAPGRGGNRIWPVPVFLGGWGGFGGYYQQPQQPTVVVVAPPPAPAGQGQVVFNQNYMPETARPVVREYNEDGEEIAPAPAVPKNSGWRTYEAPPAYQPPDPGPTQQLRSRPAARRASLPPSTVMEEKATIYLIAFRDHSIQAAYAYWVEGGTLHYVTTQGSHNRATLDLIDPTMSDRLNRERGVEFSLRK